MATPGGSKLKGSAHIAVVFVCKIHRSEYAGEKVSP